ncbi:MAG: 4a-hydroxytetrahydrobiopterin dehydratase [Flavobacteriaceae bacterium]|nr:4a-hydroxytetrahydrobiopterin dehydratase [Flavobacteriaceae bacterium]
MNDLIAFTDQEIRSKIILCAPNWTLEDKQLKRSHQCHSFISAVDLVNAIAVLAEKLHHHPKMTVDYSTLHLSLFTHDAPGITQKDFVLAQEIDTLLKK